MVRRKTAEYVFNGKPCKNGHVGPRYKNGNCVECLLNREKLKLTDPNFAKQKRDIEKQRYWADPKKHLAQQKSTREKYGVDWNAGKRLRYTTDPIYRSNVLASVKAYRVANPDSVKQSQANYHLRNKIERNQKCLLYRQVHQVTLLIKNREASRQHYQLNKEYYWVKKQKRRAACSQATPKWANLQAMAQLSKQAKETSVAFGEPFSVDHLVPLKGVNSEGVHIVSGLNWEGNMGLLPLVKNKSKGNRFWENMP